MVLLFIAFYAISFSDLNVYPMSSHLVSSSSRISALVLEVECRDRKSTLLNSSHQF